MTVEFATLTSWDGRDRWDWNALKVFLAVVADGTLAGAAEDLGVSHSTVFRRLNALEADLGGRLFDRAHGSYTPTEMGEEMLDHARRIADSFDELERRVMGRDISPRGTVVLTAPSSFAYFHLPAYLARFRTSFPDIEVELLVSNGVVNLSGRQADIAIRVASSPADHLVGRQVASVGWGLYASRSYVDEHGAPRSVQELSGHRLIGAASRLRAFRVFEWLEREHGRAIGIKTDDWVAMVALARGGHGIAVLPDDLGQPGVQRIADFEPGGVNRVWIVTHPDLRKIERVRLTMKFLAEAFLDDAAFGEPRRSG